MNTNKIAILADSGSDVPPDTAKQYHIYSLPLKINFQDGEYLDGVTITAEEVYNRLSAEIPKTSLPDGDQIHAVLDQIRADGYEKVFAVTISSGLSGTYNILRLICEEYEGLDCYVLDSKNVSIGSGMLAIQAAQYLESGMGWEELIATMPSRIPDSKVFFCVKTLEYLQKGGRLGLIASLLGSAIALKPIISCNDDGVYFPIAKAIGRKASIKKVIELAGKFAAGSKRVELALMHGNAKEEADGIVEEVKNIISNGKITVWGQISPALGVHTGPGLIGIGVMRQI